MLLAEAEATKSELHTQMNSLQQQLSQLQDHSSADLQR